MTGKIEKILDNKSINLIYIYITISKEIQYINHKKSIKLIPSAGYCSIPFKVPVLLFPLLSLFQIPYKNLHLPGCVQGWHSLLHQSQWECDDAV